MSACNIVNIRQARANASWQERAGNQSAAQDRSSKHAHLSQLTEKDGPFVTVTHGLNMKVPIVGSKNVIYYHICSLH